LLDTFHNTNLLEAERTVGRIIACGDCTTAVLPYTIGPWIKKSSAKHRSSAKAAQSIPPSTWQMLGVSFGEVVKITSDVRLAIQGFNSQPASEHCKAMLPQTLQTVIQPCSRRHVDHAASLSSLLLLPSTE
jgi:hypothetical protein